MPDLSVPFGKPQEEASPQQQDASSIRDNILYIESKPKFSNIVLKENSIHFKPYHEKFRIYLDARKGFFLKSNFRQKRELVISAVFQNRMDMHSYATVSFLDLEK